MTTHDEFAAAAAAYAIDALDRDEARLFEAHLATCAECQRDLAEYRRVAAGLGLAVDPAVPAPDLKARVLARATAQPQSSVGIKARPTKSGDGPRLREQDPSPNALENARQSGRLPWWLLAAAAMAFLATGFYAWSLRTQLAAVRDTANLAATEARDTRAAMANMRLDAARLSRAVDVISSPDVVRVELAGQATAKSATGRAYWSRTRGLVFSASLLPALPAGRVYQLWVLAPTPVSVGVLSVNPDGSTSLTTTLASNLPPVAAVAVTAEPGPAGSAAPTMPILLVGAVKGTAGN